MKHLTKNYLVALANSFATVMREYVDITIQRTLDALPQPGKGDKGDTGKDGRDGRDGKDGRDAVEQLEILPGIHVERSYPRGTLATWKGGLWQAQRATNQMDGWMCILEGIDRTEVEMKDERSFSVTTVFSSGVTRTANFSIPSVVYKGIYKRGVTFEAGDAVTHQGSLWIAQKQTNAVPGDGDDYRLAVKRGRDGKDGDKGPKGDAGTAGRNGRDLTQLGTNGEKW